ncbi:hypothetical protein STENM223S_01592 [Streptomyces tendae]
MTALRPAGVPGVGSVTSWRKPVRTYALRERSYEGLERLRTTRTTRFWSSMIRIRTSARVPSATASWTTPVISFQSTGFSRARTWASVRVACSPGSPSSRAATASTVTSPVAVSQCHKPVSRAARTSPTEGKGSPVRIAPLYEDGVEKFH